MLSLRHIRNPVMDLSDQRSEASGHQYNFERFFHIYSNLLKREKRRLAKIMKGNAWYKYPCRYFMEKTLKNSSKQIAQIYDRIFKKILTLSTRSVILFINGLFGTEYPPDSVITYNWTEHHDDNLKKTLADTIITINHSHSYHVEAQMYDDEEIEFRVFDYSYGYALKTRQDADVLRFPEPQIIYLYNHRNIPDVKKIYLDFGTQGSFIYHVPVFKLLEHTTEELSSRKMVILIPFMILKLRDSIKKERTHENMEALRILILDDILNVINENQALGNITSADANKLRSLIQKLYNHLYSHYEEFIEGGFNDMMEDGLVLEADILEAELTKKITERVTREIREQITQEVTEQVTQDTIHQNQKDIICKLYSKLGDIDQVSELLDLSYDMIQKTIQE